jgi:hypothetical protein
MSEQTPILFRIGGKIEAGEMAIVEVNVGRLRRLVTSDQDDNMEVSGGCTSTEIFSIPRSSTCTADPLPTEAKRR